MPPLRRVPWPLAVRSKPSVALATFQPSPAGPTRMSSPTRTPDRNTSLNDEAPLICRIGRISTPGASIGIRNMVSPACLATSRSVRASSSP